MTEETLKLIMEWINGDIRLSTNGRTKLKLEDNVPVFSYYAILAYNGALLYQYDRRSETV